LVFRAGWQIHGLRENNSNSAGVEAVLLEECIEPPAPCPDCNGLLSWWSLPECPKTEHVITQYRSANQNLRSRLLDIIWAAGLKEWPKRCRIRCSNLPQRVVRVRTQNRKTLVLRSLAVPCDTVHK